MTWRDYQLGSIVSRTAEAMTLWKTERGILQIGEGTLAVPIMSRDQREGFIFHGHGKLILDTIVETESGAVGKPTERELNEPFLMIGDAEKTREKLSGVGPKDLEKMGYKDQKEFIERARAFFDRFLRAEDCKCLGLGKYHGIVFAFVHDGNGLDVLAVKGTRFVYIASEIVFVSNGDKVVLTSPGEVVCSDHGKLLVVKKACRY
jgi:hypothetical protein